MIRSSLGPSIVSLRADAYTIPTDAPEADGTFSWSSTTLVVVEIRAGDARGLGYTYTDACAAALLNGAVAEAVKGGSPLDIPALHLAVRRRVRNLGRSGLCATALSALDLALWDLKGHLLGLSVVNLLGACRDAVPIYGSGGFTTYSAQRLAEQLSGWCERDGCRWVKMKVGTDPSKDIERVAGAKRAIGGHVLFVDANGAYASSQAIAFACAFSEQAVEWFEEPVSSDDLEGLRQVRLHTPDGMEIAAGEYGYTADDFRRMLSSGGIDVQQADVTRCGGITGFLQVGAMCEAHHVSLSGHCAPAAHLAVACAIPRLRHLEWFHDHVRIEQELFDGAPQPQEGAIRPDRARPGLGIDFKRADAERYRV